ncbi:MAG: NAD(P)H-hydrate dehydratase [Pseudobdellovibrionaceae bacterium]
MNAKDTTVLVLPSMIMMTQAHIVLRKEIQKWLPRRRPDDNKSAGGRVLILAGSDMMPGAAMLAAKAASRCGAGYIYIIEKQVLNFMPEAILWNGKDLYQFDAVLVGPGLGISKKTAALIQRLKKSRSPVVIDADALTVAAAKKMYPFPTNWIATPHESELSRFFKIEPTLIRKKRLQFCKQGQSLLGCTILLKGRGSLISNSTKTALVPTGNVALAKGGSGDVLAGMIAAFIAQGLSPEKAAILACWIHGDTADQWIKDGKDELSFSPSDLLDSLPLALARLRK